jgi:hypothetical protein
MRYVNHIGPNLLHWNAVATLVHRWKVGRSPSTKRPTISNLISKSLQRRHTKIECQNLWWNLDKNRSQQLSWTHRQGLQEAGKTRRRSKIGCQTLYPAHRQASSRLPRPDICVCVTCHMPTRSKVSRRFDGHDDYTTTHSLSHEYLNNTR